MDHQFEDRLIQLHRSEAKNPPLPNNNQPPSPVPIPPQRTSRKLTPASATRRVVAEERAAAAAAKEAPSPTRSAARSTRTSIVRPTVPRAAGRSAGRITKRYTRSRADITAEKRSASEENAENIRRGTRVKDELSIRRESRNESMPLQPLIISDIIDEESLELKEDPGALSSDSSSFKASKGAITKSTRPMIPLQETIRSPIPTMGRNIGPIIATFQDHDHDQEQEAPPPSVILSPVLKSAGMRSPPRMTSPTKKVVYDRYIPMREGNLAEQFQLLPDPDAPLTPNRQRARAASITPSQPAWGADAMTPHDIVVANEIIPGHRYSPNSQNALASQRRLFSYAQVTLQNVRSFDSPMRQVYSSTPISQESRDYLMSPKKSQRKISEVPFKVLDAPGLADDYYLNLVDWSSQNVLGVGLRHCVYLWDALTGTPTQLCTLNERVTSINWVSTGIHMAIGTDSGEVQIWDVQKGQRVRTMTGHTQRVGVLAWNDHILSSGGRDRKIFQRDVRSEEMFQKELSSHRAEVCGLKWNSSGTQLASGGNDNMLMIWEKDSTEPLFQFDDHQAAVKAIDWSPHQKGILASGGGTLDKHIRFWETNTGQAIGAVDTGSQVCNLAWSRTTNEIVSTHGFSQNLVVIWKYPTMQEVKTLKGHQNRVLYLALSPDGQTIVTGAGAKDESLRLWNVFKKPKTEGQDGNSSESHLTTIR
ncbi:substrate-specific activator of APC-dependent proteolysis [Lunasporangiospora selenospora]|uniref:Substrate-specific activator of APC-dependent proteolysis n=1 Tax=Lunasporangiospora selenospora TaxID=979761 RepID=A0A9P6G119_9FUNG|nr:substrate-specific activator of APC-dependent proteolysis [Lunasporangiospora selenospora]